VSPRRWPRSARVTPGPRSWWCRRADLRSRSGARPGGHADRVGAIAGPAGPPGPVPAGAFLGEPFDAHLTRTVLGTARQPDPVTLRLSTQRSVDVVLGLGLGRSRPGRRRHRSVGVAIPDADRDRAVAPAARLALGVCVCLCVGLALRLLQAPTLAQRRADLAAALLADASAGMGDRLLLLRCGRRCLGHRVPEYRCESRERLGPTPRAGRRTLATAGVADCGGSDEEAQ
jgi:hypothetical protein